MKSFHIIQTSLFLILQFVIVSSDCTKIRCAPLLTIVMHTYLFCYESMDAIQPAAYKNTIKFVFYYCRDPIASHSQLVTMKKSSKKNGISDIYLHIYTYFGLYHIATREPKKNYTNLFACTFKETTKKRHTKYRERIHMNNAKNIMKYLLSCSLFRINKICILSLFFVFSRFFFHSLSNSLQTTTTTVLHIQRTMCTGDLEWVLLCVLRLE